MTSDLDDASKQPVPGDGGARPLPRARPATEHDRAAWQRMRERLWTEAGEPHHRRETRRILDDPSTSAVLSSKVCARASMRQRAAPATEAEP